MNLGDWGGEARIEIDFGAGPATVHFSVTGAPGDESPAVAIHRVTHLGSELTLSDQQRALATQRILEQWRLS